MNILITVSTYYPKKDGVQNVTQYLAEGMAKRGHNVTVITTDRDEKIDFEIHNGVVIKRVNLYTKYGIYLGNKKKYKEIIKNETEKADVMINVCTQNAFTDIILKNISEYKCIKILYLHGIFNFKFQSIDFSSFTSTVNKLWKEIRWFFYYNLNSKYFKKYDYVTQLHEKDYGNLFFKKKYNIDSIIIENAANDDFFSRKVVTDFKKPFDKYLIYVANYDDRKNQKLAIREFLKSNIDKNIGLVLIGSEKNNYYDNLVKYEMKLRKKYGLTLQDKPINMLYNINRNLISSYVSSAYLYLMTSKWEAYPISIVEAMAAGIPYICTNVGIVKYFVGGIISNDDDFHYWIEKITNNENVRNDLSKLCYEYAKENFKIDNKINIIEECFK